MLYLYFLLNFWVRASFPRLRFDQLMVLGWCHILPITLAFFLLIPSLLITFNSPPTLPELNLIDTLAFIFFTPRLAEKSDTITISYTKDRKSPFEIPTPESRK